MIASDRKRRSGKSRKERQGVQSMERQGGSVSAGGRKEHAADGSEPQVTQAAQDAIENTVGKAVLAKDGEHDGAQPVILGLYTAHLTSGLFLTTLFPRHS